MAQFEILFGSCDHFGILGRDIPLFRDVALDVVEFDFSGEERLPNRLPWAEPKRLLAALLVELPAAGRLIAVARRDIDHRAIPEIGHKTLIGTRFANAPSPHNFTAKPTSLFKACSVNLKIETFAMFEMQLVMARLLQRQKLAENMLLSSRRMAQRKMWCWRTTSMFLGCG